MGFSIQRFYVISTDILMEFEIAKQYLTSNFTLKMLFRNILNKKGTTKLLSNMKFPLQNLLNLQI